MSRAKTLNRRRLQGQAGWPVLSKVAIVGGQFRHPTKKRPPLGAPTFEQTVVRPPRPKIHPVQEVVQRMTNWQRTQYNRTLSELRREEKKLTEESHLALALSFAELERRP